jgi:twitching motility two-component system response regulator PilG
LKWAMEKQNAAQSTWKCPLDTTSSVKQTEQCAHCKVNLSFNDADGFLNNQEFQCPQIRELAQHIEQQGVSEQDFNRHANLAVIYLNLREFEKAFQHLKVLQRIRPNDRDLMVRISELMKRLRDAYKPPRPAAVEEVAKGTILVVDDSATVRKVVSILLQKEHFKVICATDGMDALTVLNDQTPDLIFLDITMPRIDGYTLCKLIRGDEKTKNIPVIMLSGKDGFFDKVRGRMSGSTDHISKPFKSSTLIQAVEKYTKTQAG